MRIENPRAVQEDETHGGKVTVWCAIHSELVQDPHYFNNQTVSREDSSELLNTSVRNERQNISENVLFQQDGAPAYTSRDICALFKKIFEENWIVKHGPVNWPPRASNRTPLRYFLWGYVKTTTFETPESDLTQLERRIAQLG